MERKIEQIFLDKSNNIYVVDSKNILYLYDSDDREFFPFLAVMNNIKNCFAMDNNFFVHHSNTISIFDDELLKIDIPGETWISHKIDCVCYNTENNTIVTLEHGEVNVNFNVAFTDNYYGDDIKIISLSRKRFLDSESSFTECIEFDEIKILDDLLLLLKNDEMSIYYLQPNNIKYIGGINTNKKIYDEIYHFHKIHSYFELQNGDKLTLSGEYFLQKYTSQTIDNNVFWNQNVYFMLKDEYLLCYYDKIKYDFIIEPLLSILNATNMSTIDVNYKNQQLTTILLPKNINISIINNNRSQIIVYGDKYYLVKDILHEIYLLDNVIQYGTIHANNIEKIKQEFIIDIENSESIVNQLVNTVSSIYRLNNEYFYKFEKIDNFGNVISYGEGATRDTFNYLRKELDTVLKSNFSSLKQNMFKLGKLFYFCNAEGNEKYFNMHPYFFYLLSDESDYVTLLKKFKGADYNNYYKLYVQYLNEPESMEQLDMEIKTHHDYIKYLFTCDLTDIQIEQYNEFVKGFSFYSIRTKYYNFIKNLPISYYIDLLIATGYFNAQLNFVIKNGLIHIPDFIIFQKKFKKIFEKLSKEEISLFVQNVTGSQYYNGIINIVYGYEKKEFIVKQVVYDENINNGNMPLEINNAIINLDTEVDTKLSYQISTCNTELLVNVAPTKNNIMNIIKMLTVEDIIMKN